MHNLHRELAPVSDAAWAQIEPEAARTFKRHIAGRRVVDVRVAGDEALAAVGTGHQRALDPPAAGVLAQQREVVPLVELRAPFRLGRQTIDDVERGGHDTDLQPLKDATRQLALAEDGIVLDGYAAAAIRGVRQACSNPPAELPDDVREYPQAVAHALTTLRLAGVEGPYAAVLSAAAFTAVSETSDHGYPVLRHLERLGTEIVWGPGIDGALVLSTRGGDFDLRIGQDVSIGYLDHTASEIGLYLQETLAFLVYTSEAAVVLRAPGRATARRPARPRG